MSTKVEFKTVLELPTLIETSAPTLENDLPFIERAGLKWASIENLANSRALPIYLADFLSATDQAEPVGIEEALPLDGGFVLLLDETPAAYPRCCSDLSTWKEWLSAAECNSAHPELLWVGHPELYVSAIDPDHISVTITPDIDGQSERVVTIRRKELITGIQHVHRLLQSMLPIIEANLPMDLKASSSEFASKLLAIDRSLFE
tara:strand:+ start:164 stop:775 length:612 start_codon:yes stop_codon:yes gene_type:complete